MLKQLKNVDKMVSDCNLCDGLVDKFCNSTTIYLGKDNDILLIGEAPANNGWRKSGMLWRDTTGKMLPSGVVLQKLFDEIDRKVLETSFLEAVKCYPLERKNLKHCSINCKQYMMKQIEIINPKLIITLGEFPTRSLLNFDFKKFKDVVGNIYEIDGYKVLPIYHPSPISPLSYKGNVPILKKVKRYL